MSEQIDIGGVAGRDLVFYYQLFLNGKPLSLASYTPKVIVKASRTAADGTGTAYAVGSGLVITSASLGMMTLTVPASATGTAGTTWHRCDVSNGPQSFTAAFGNFVLVPA